jgi:hypothetical protein
MFSMSEARRFGYNISSVNTSKLEDMMKDLNSINCELTLPQKALKDMIEIELEKRTKNS